MNRYAAPMRDMKFALFDVLEGEKQFAQLGIHNAQRDIMDAVLEEASKFAEQILAPTNSVGDEIMTKHFRIFCAKFG